MLGSIAPTAAGKPAQPQQRSILDLLLPTKRKDGKVKAKEEAAVVAVGEAKAREESVEAAPAATPPCNGGAVLNGEANKGSKRKVESASLGGIRLKKAAPRKKLYRPCGRKAKASPGGGGAGSGAGGPFEAARVRLSGGASAGLPPIDAVEITEAEEARLDSLLSFLDSTQAAAWNLKKALECGKKPWRDLFKDYKRCRGVNPLQLHWEQRYRPRELKAEHPLLKWLTCSWQQVGRASLSGSGSRGGDEASQSGSVYRSDSEFEDDDSDSDCGRGGGRVTWTRKPRLSV